MASPWFSDLARSSAGLVAYFRSKVTRLRHTLEAADSEGFEATDCLSHKYCNKWTIISVVFQKNIWVGIGIRKNETLWLPFLNDVYFEARTNQAENVKQHWIYEECHVFKAQLAFETPSLQLKEGRAPPALNSLCKNARRITKSSEANHTHPDTSSETSESHSIYVTPQQDQRQLLNPRLNVHKIGLPTQKVCLMINSDLNLITNKISKKIQYNCGLNFRLSCNMCWATNAKLSKMQPWHSYIHTCAIKAKNLQMYCVRIIRAAGKPYGHWHLRTLNRSKGSELRTEHFGSEMQKSLKNIWAVIHTINKHNLALILLV